MTQREDPAPLPATAPWLLHSLRTLFDARHVQLVQEARKACVPSDAREIQVKFIHRCMQVTALFDPTADRFTELRACDIGEIDREQPSYCITVKLTQTEI